MGLQTKEIDEEDDITFLYRAVNTNLFKVPDEYKDEAYTSMLFRGMAMLKKGENRGYIFNSLNNKSIDWIRFAKRRKELDKERIRRDDMEEEIVWIDNTEKGKYRNIVACLGRVQKCSTDAQKRVIRDILKFIIKNPKKFWEVKDASVRLKLSKARTHKLVREIKSLYNALFNMDRGDDEKTVTEIYDSIKFKR